MSALKWLYIQEVQQPKKNTAQQPGSPNIASHASHGNTSVKIGGDLSLLKNIYRDDWMRDIEHATSCCKASDLWNLLAHDLLYL